MAIKFDVKQLTSGMNVHDKARLIIADIEEQIKTDGATRLLSPYEKDALFTDARKNNELKELFKIYDLYKYGFLIYEELCEKIQSFAVATGYTERLITGIHVAGRAKDAIVRIFHDFPKDIRREALYQKYASDLDFLSQYGLLTNDEEGEPHIKLQESFMEVIKFGKKIKGLLYKAEYTRAKTEVNIIRNEHQELMNECENTLDKLIELDNTFKLFRIFRDYDVVTTKTTHELKFIDTIRDMQRAFDITEEEKKQVRERVEKYFEN